MNVRYGIQAELAAADLTELIHLLAVVLKRLGDFTGPRLRFKFGDGFILLREPCYVKSLVKLWNAQKQIGFIGSKPRAIIDISGREVFRSHCDGSMTPHT